MCGLFRPMHPLARCNVIYVTGNHRSLRQLADRVLLCPVTSIWYPAYQRCERYFFFDVVYS